LQFAVAATEEEGRRKVALQFETDCAERKRLEGVSGTVYLGSELELAGGDDNNTTGSRKSPVEFVRVILDFR
jgi:hypothetical protein